MNLFKIIPLNVTTINTWRYICLPLFKYVLKMPLLCLRQIWRSAVGSPQCNPCLPSFVLGMCPSFRYGKTEIFWAAAMTKSESLTNPQMPVVWTMRLFFFFFREKNYFIIYDSSIFRLSLIYKFENQADRKIVPNHWCGAWNAA